MKIKLVKIFIAVIHHCGNNNIIFQCNKSNSLQECNKNKNIITFHDFVSVVGMHNNLVNFRVIAVVLV